MLEQEKPILEEKRNVTAIHEGEALKFRDQSQVRLKKKDLELEACRISLAKLEDLSQYSAAFQTIFGDVDPNMINPREEESKTQEQRHQLKIELAEQVQASAILKKLSESADAFKNEFGEANLKTLDRVMARTPNARFFVEAEVASEEGDCRTGYLRSCWPVASMYQACRRGTRKNSEGRSN